MFFVGEGAVGVEVEPGFLDQPEGVELVILSGVAAMSRSAKATASGPRSWVWREIARARHTGTRPP